MSRLTWRALALLVALWFFTKSVGLGALTVSRNGRLDPAPALLCLRLLAARDPALPPAAAAAAITGLGLLSNGRSIPGGRRLSLVPSPAANLVCVSYPAPTPANGYYFDLAPATPHAAVPVRWVAEACGSQGGGSSNGTARLGGSGDDLSAGGDDGVSHVCAGGAWTRVGASGWMILGSHCGETQFFPSVSFPTPAPANDSKVRVKIDHQIDPANVVSWMGVGVVLGLLFTLLAMAASFGFVQHVRAIFVAGWACAVLLRLAAALSLTNQVGRPLSPFLPSPSPFLPSTLLFSSLLVRPHTFFL